MKYLKALKMDRKEKWTSEDGWLNRYLFPHYYVGEIISETRISEWRYYTPIFIDSQTGSGKSRFIIDTLIPFMKNRGKRILILCNRVALKKQYKKEVMKKEMPDRVGDYTDQGLDKEHTFGIVDIYSYQELQWLIFNKNWPEYEYGAVILDECHYFISDSSFNRMTQEVLEQILKMQRLAIRIYLTATPECIFDELFKRECKMNYSLINSITASQRVWGGCLGMNSYNNFPHGIMYEFQRDYTYLTPFFFKKREEIVKLISEDKSAAKWLVFVDKKEAGINLMEDLGKMKVNYLDAGLKNNEKKEAFENLIQEKTFPQKVLIVTKFLDVGVDLWDSSICNVVIFSNVKTDFLQMIGRKRVKKGETVNLYIHVCDVKEYRKLLKEKKRRYKDMCIACDEKNNPGFYNELPFPCYTLVSKPQEIKIKFNGFSLLNAKQEINALEEVLGKCEMRMEGQSVDEIIARYYLEWIESEPFYNKNMWVDMVYDNIGEEIKSILEPIVNEPMSTEDFKIIKDKLLVLYKNYTGNKVRKSRENDGLGVPHIKAFLKDVQAPYCLGPKKNNKYIFTRGMQK